MPLFECLKDYKKFFIVYIIVQFSKAECPGVESNRVNILSSAYRYNGCQSVVSVREPLKGDYSLS